MLTRLPALAVFLAALVFVAGPALVPEFGGFDPALYPIPQDDPPVQPAGYAFAIWGPIYLWLLAYAGFGLFKRGDDPAWAAHRPAMFISLALGAGWLFVAVQSAFWAFVVIWAMLISAAVAFVQAPKADRWWAVAPIALYAGWLTAASSASLGLVGAGWGVVFGEVVWALISIGVALVATLIIRAARPGEWLYLTSVIWALIAIAVKNWGDVWSVAGVAAAGAVIVTALAVYSMSRR